MADLNYQVDVPPAQDRWLADLAQTLPTDWEIVVRRIDDARSDASEPAEPIPNFVNRFRDAEGRIHQLEAKMVKADERIDTELGRIRLPTEILENFQESLAELEKELSAAEGALVKRLDRLQRRVKKLEDAS